MIAEGAMRVEVGLRGAYKGPQASLSLSLLLFFPPLSFSLSLFPVPDVAKRMLETLVDYSLYILFFSLKFSPFVLFNFPFLPPPPPLSPYLSIRLHFSQCAKRCNRIHLYTRTFGVHMRFSRSTTWMQRSDVNVTTGHVVTFNNVVKLRGRGKRSNDDSEGANATLRRNRGYKRTADGRPTSKPTNDLNSSLPCWSTGVIASA